MSSTVGITLRSSIMAALGVGGRRVRKTPRIGSAEPRGNRRHGLELARRGTRRLESRHRRARRNREHGRADRSADAEDRAVRRRAAERGTGSVRQLRRRRHERPDDTRPRCIGVEQHADPAERSSHAGLRHQSRARRSEHRRAARARASRGAGRRRFVGLRLRRRRGCRQLHHATQRRRSRSVAADGRWRRVRNGQCRGARRNDLGRRLAARLLQLFRPRQPRSRRPGLCARESNGARRPRLHVEPLRSGEHHRRTPRRRTTRLTRRRAPSPATAIRRCTRTCSPARLVTASSRRFSKTSAIA